MIAIDFISTHPSISMAARRTFTGRILHGTCGCLLLLSTACNSGNQPAAPASTPEVKTPDSANKAPSKPPLAEQAPAPVEQSPAPQFAQPAPTETPPSTEQPRYDSPLNPRIVPQVSQQNLYSGGQPPQGMPQVALSEQHALTCPIQVGQDFPSVTLPNQAGKPQELSKLRGKFTLVVLWSAGEPAAVEELGDLDAYAYQPYKNVGLNVVAIHTAAGKSKAPAETLQKIKPTFTNLIDTQGELWAKLGKGNLPRTFLLDAQGKVLWFDIEYSRTTRRQLQQALQAVMQEI